MLGWELPPYNSGGLGVACYHLCKALAKKDIDLEFILPYQAEHNIDFMKITAAQPQGVSEIVRSGIAYDSYKYVLQDGRVEWHDIYSKQLLYESSVERIIGNKPVDIVHAHDWLTFRAALRVRARKNCPVILHVHSIESDRAGGKRGNPLVHEIEETAFWLADRIIAVSALTKRAIIKDYGIPADKIEVVHNHLDTESLEAISDVSAYTYLESLRSQGWRVVANIGRLTVQKGLVNLLHAAREVIAREPKTMFLLVGSGEQYHELIELAAELGISKNVIFTGFLRGKAWRDSYGIGDLFVMPSVSEPFGLTVLESIAYGTPTLISKQSGVSEVIKNSLKVDFWDIQEMANQIVGALRSDGLRNTLSQSAQVELGHLSWDQAADQVAELYRQHTHQVVAA
jgi:glycosyltransferase involved in cell wall biosynthesis